MAELIKLKAELREETGKGAAKRMRRSSKIPGIFYKGGEDAIWLQFHNKDVDNVLAKKPRLFSVAWGEGEDESQECMFREIQRHPVSQKPVHLDLMGITRGVKIETTVPVTLVGSPEGV
ncbi:MAG: 50S ribosomal protein L25, partial [Candidatus Electryonea clarkiae]|nr:50S ribosomal protein L25 [Candidatus Electryonea clarkiae]